MASTDIATVVKMIESLPEAAQSRVVEHLREYLADMKDEIHWDSTFSKTQPKLVEAARRARQQIAEGHAKPMDYEQL